MLGYEFTFDGLDPIKDDLINSNGYINYWIYTMKVGRVGEYLSNIN